jgi:hypothetical protein
VRVRCGGGGVVKMVWVGGGVVWRSGLHVHAAPGRSSCQMTLQRSGRGKARARAPLESWSTSKRDNSYNKQTAPSDLSCGIC